MNIEKIEKLQFNSFYSNIPEERVRVEPPTVPAAQVGVIFGDVDVVDDVDDDDVVVDVVVVVEVVETIDDKVGVVAR